MKSSNEKKSWYLLRFHYAQGFSITVLIGIMMFFCIQLKLQNKISIGDCSFIIMMTLYITEYVWTLTDYIDQIHDAIGKCQQNLREIYQPNKIKEFPFSKELIVREGKIKFDNIKFNYENHAPIFSSKTITIAAQQKIGLVGYSGSGKTTLIKLLLRLFDLQSGKIYIDGQDIKTVTQQSLHQAIAVIMQEPLLFHRSILENIRYGKPHATTAEVEKAAIIANIHHDIIRLPNGYQTVVGERGIKLSGGQKQRLAIARAVLKDAPILILDEATAELDSITETSIKTLMEQHMQNKTVIVIAHRLSTLVNMDRILVLDHGEIVADGNHLSLLQSNRLYAKFWQSQNVEDIIDAQAS